MHNSITTKKGDFGLTRLGNASYVRKDHATMDALGDIDELNAVLGMVKCYTVDPEVQEKIESWQKTLINLSGVVSNYTVKSFVVEAMENLEQFREILESKLNLPHFFIIPGTNLANAYLHFARTVCRRAERRVCTLLNDNPSLTESIIPFFNRLSDVLWLMALKAEK